MASPSDDALVWCSAASPLAVSTSCPSSSSASSSSSSSSLLRVRVRDRRAAAGLVLLESPCACPATSHSQWLDASTVTIVHDASHNDTSRALLGRGPHEPPFEDEHDAQLSLYVAPQLGRFVAARRAIPLGTCALSATAFAVVVSDRMASRTCHWCFTTLTKKAFRCGACEFALYCSRVCLEADAVLHDPQCEPLRALRLQALPTSSITTSIDHETLRLTLAVLTMEVFVANPQALATLHVPVTPHDPMQARALDHATQVLRRSLKKIDASSSSALRLVKRPHIRETIRRIQHNAHPLLLNGTSGVCGLGLFPEAAMTLNHSCVPNVVPSFDPTTRSLRFHAVRAIEPMQLIEYSYLSDLTVGRVRRQATLRDGFGFDCECPRCVAEASSALDVQGSSAEEQQVLQQLVTLSAEHDPLAVGGKLRLLETRHAAWLRAHPDTAFSFKILELRSATQTNDWRRVLELAETLLTLWETVGLPEWYPTTETLHQQIAVAAMRLGDTQRAQAATASVTKIQRVCGFRPSALPPAK